MYHKVLFSFGNVLNVLFLSMKSVEIENMFDPLLSNKSIMNCLLACFAMITRHHN
jgi:hypothetical protein